MRYYFILILSLSFTLSVFGQADTGFTNKAEAKNQKVNGLKEGKWIQYFNTKNGIEQATNNKNAPYYRLTVYKADKPVGIERMYYESGKIEGYVTYVNGKQNGDAKGYYETGELLFESHFEDGERNGVVKTYYRNGKIKSEVAYINDNAVSTKNYDEYGNKLK